MSDPDIINLSDSDYLAAYKVILHMLKYPPPVHIDGLLDPAAMREESVIKTTRMVLQTLHAMDNNGKSLEALPESITIGIDYFMRILAVNIHLMKERNSKIL